MKFPVRPAWALSTLAVAVSGAWAQAATTPEPAASVPETSLPAVKVQGAAETATGPVSGYRAKRAISATKTDTPLREVPQSITVVTRDQIVDQGATTLQDALNYAAGVRSDAYGLDGRSDGIRIRGTDIPQYLDGLRQSFGYYTSSTRADPYTLERIEVLRGPSAMLFGQGSTGGVVNMVSKRPQAEASREIGVQYGSHDRKQVQADFTGPLTADGDWLYRVVAVARKSDTQVDYVRDDRALLAPSLTWRPDAATSLALMALAQKDRSGSTSQFFPWSGVVLDNLNGKLPTNRFIGEPGWDRYDSDRRSIGWAFEHRVNDTWTVRQNTRYSINDVDYFTHYGDSFSSSTDFGDPNDATERLIGRYADATITRVKMLTADQHVEGHLTTGEARHTLLAGLDLARSATTGEAGIDFPTYLGGTTQPIDAYDPVYGNFTPPAMSQVAPSVVRQGGLYVQDQVRFGRWVGVAGLRHDRTRNETTGSETTSAHATSKRFGVMYDLPGGLTPYVGYSESFSVQLNINGQRFAPLRGKQWEAGLKYEPVGGGYSLNAAAYDLREKNKIAERQPGVFDALPEVKGHGVELEAKGSLGALDMVAHYNQIHVDDAIEAVPTHQASLWGSYRFALGGVSGLRAGAGVRWFSAFHDGVAPTTPSVALLDAMVAWDVERWRVALNVSNLTDKVYVSTCLSRGDCWFGSRRNAVASVTYRF